MTHDESNLRIQLAEARVLIKDLHDMMRWADAMNVQQEISDPVVQEGMDFTFWADECAKNLGLMETGNAGDRLMSF